MNPHLSPILLLSLSLPAVAPQETTGSKLLELDKLFAAHVDSKRSPGLSVAIIEGGRLVFAKGYGKQSIEDDVSVATDTRFGIGSVTKQFTCSCVLMLAEDGKLSLYDPVAKYYPNLKRAKDITVLDLMNHAALVVSNDTGPAHLSIALGTPTVVIVGGGHIGSFVPYPEGISPDTARFVFHEMECFHCFWRCHLRANKFQIFPCIGAINEDHVWNACEDLMEQAGA